MKRLAIALAALALTAQTPAASSGATRHLTYQFGYNTNVASSGQGTGTTAIDISGPAQDGSLSISGADSWWNTVRARATNTCTVSKSGDVNCSQAPYAISPIQVTIFPLYGRNVFKGLAANPTSKWEQTFTIYAAVLPGASGLAGQPNTWKCVLDFQGKGFAKNSNHIIELQATGTATQQGGRYGAGDVKLGMLYDTNIKLPVFVSETRARLPQTSVYNKDLVQLKLTKVSSSP